MLSLRQCLALENHSKEDAHFLEGICLFLHQAFFPEIILNTGNDYDDDDNDDHGHAGAASCWCLLMMMKMTRRMLLKVVANDDDDDNDAAADSRQ